MTKLFAAVFAAAMVVLTALSFDSRPFSAAVMVDGLGLVSLAHATPVAEGTDALAGRRSCAAVPDVCELPPERVAALGGISPDDVPSGGSSESGQATANDLDPMPLPPSPPEFNPSRKLELVMGKDTPDAERLMGALMKKMAEQAMKAAAKNGFKEPSVSPVMLLWRDVRDQMVYVFSPGFVLRSGEMQGVYYKDPTSLKWKFMLSRKELLLP